MLEGYSCGGLLFFDVFLFVILADQSLIHHAEFIRLCRFDLGLSIDIAKA